jgi:hypothetical protein
MRATEFIQEAEKKSWDYDLRNNPWRVTDVDAVTETDFEVALLGPNNQQLNFIIRPIDFIEQQTQRFQIDSMDVRDLQTGKTKHVQSGQDMGSWIYIFDAIDEYFWQSPPLQKHLKKIIDYYMDAGEQGKSPDLMPGLSDRPIQTGIPADRFIKAHQDMKKVTGQQDTGIDENFADGRVKGKSRPGRVKKSDASCNGSVTDLRARAKRASGEKARMYHWCANMKSGKKK